MAVPGRRNGMMEDDEEINGVEQEVLFEDGAGGLVVETEIPPHLLPLAEAAESGNVGALLSALDDLNGSIDDPVEDGDTALHLSCLYGHLPCVQLLLERGASVEAKDEEGGIPLHDACAGGFVEIVQLLMNAGGPECLQRMLSTVDVEGDTPLHHAARGEHLSVVRLLLTAGASPTKTNIYGKIPAELAEPETEVRRYLEDAAASANPLPCQ